MILVTVIERKLMNIAVVFQTRSGNTKIVADAIASALGVEAKSVTEPYEGADLLFIGGGVYGLDVDPTMKTFLDALNAKTTKRIVAFSTTGMTKSAVKKIMKAAKLKKIPVDKKDHLVIKLGFDHKSKPQETHKQQAVAWAESVVASLDATPTLVATA